MRRPRRRTILFAAACGAYLGVFSPAAGLAATASSAASPLPPLPVTTLDGDTIDLSRPGVPLLVVGVSATGDARPGKAPGRAFDDTAARLAVVARVAERYHDRGARGAAVLMAVNPFTGSLPGLLVPGGGSGVTLLVDSAGAVRFADPAIDEEAAMEAAGRLVAGETPVLLAARAPYRVAAGETVVFTAVLVNATGRAETLFVTVVADPEPVAWGRPPGAEPAAGDAWTLDLGRRFPSEVVRFAIEGTATGPGEARIRIAAALGAPPDRDAAFDLDARVPDARAPGARAPLALDAADVRVIVGRPAWTWPAVVAILIAVTVAAVILSRRRRM